MHIRTTDVALVEADNRGSVFHAHLWLREAFRCVCTESVCVRACVCDYVRAWVCGWVVGFACVRALTCVCVCVCARARVSVCD